MCCWLTVAWRVMMAIVVLKAIDSRRRNQKPLARVSLVRAMSFDKVVIVLCAMPILEATRSLKQHANAAPSSLFCALRFMDAFVHVCRALAYATANRQKPLLHVETRLPLTCGSPISEEDARSLQGFAPFDMPLSVSSPQMVPFFHPQARFNLGFYSCCCNPCPFSTLTR